jgi:hypothetical protein
MDVLAEVFQTEKASSYALFPKKTNHCLTPVGRVKSNLTLTSDNRVADGMYLSLNEQNLIFSEPMLAHISAYMFLYTEDTVGY